MKLSDLQQKLQGASLEGDDCEVDAVALAGEGEPGVAELWFAGEVESATVVIVDSSVSATAARSVLRVPDLNKQLPVLLHCFNDNRDEWGISEQSVLAEDFEFSEPVFIGPFVYIGRDVKIGKNVKIDPGVKIKGKVEIGSGTHIHSNVSIVSPTKIGENCIIHANTVIGADGYGFRQIDGKHHKVPQVGGVVIGDDVEIGGLCTVDRGTITDTTIGSGTKIDDQVHIAHNCKVGSNCLMAGKAGLSGSVIIGDNVTLAGLVAVTDHVSIADNVTVAGRSGVTSDIKEKGIVVSGFPAKPHREQLRLQASQRRIPQLRKKVKELETKIKEIERESEER